MKVLKLLSLTITFTSLISVEAVCQYNYIHNRWNIKVGYARYKISTRNNDVQPTIGNYRLEFNYGFLKNIESGFYLGYSSYRHMNTSPRYHTPYYGINLNFHLLPFLINKPDFRFDLYLGGKAGGFYFRMQEMHMFEYSVGAGMCFYPWKHLGIYTEYGFGNYLYEDNFNSRDHSKFRYGLSFKF